MGIKKGVFALNKEEKRKTGTARLWELASTQKGLVAGACILSVVSVLVSFLPFVAIYFIIRELLANAANLAALNGPLMVRYGWLACGGAVGAIALNFAALMCSHLAAFKTLYHLKLEFTRHLASLPLGFHTHNSTGKLRKIVDENIEKLEGFIAHQLPDLVGSFATPVVVLVILLAVDWRLGLAALVPILLSYVVQMVAYGGGRSREFMKQYQDAMEDMNNSSVEYVRGISVVKAFNQTIFSFRRFYNSIHAYTEFVYSYTKSFQGAMATFMVIVNNVYLLVLPVGILLYGGAQDYGRYALAVLFYLIFCLSITAPFTKLMYVSSGMTQIADGITRMDRILDTQPLPKAQQPQTAAGSDIVFDKVSFSYNGEGEAEAISEVSFAAPQGHITALVGPSGSGKSTIAHLIPRFYDVAAGSISIGGVDIREMDNDYLLQKVSFVFQDVFLFKQSVLDNIKVGNPEATEEQVMAAAKAAQCHDFVQKLPSGYHTVIGAEGVHLSGGEKQRLVIARAILKNAPILVLDEATAFADPENEHKIQKAFEVLMRDKTVIIIAHRLSTVRGAHNIIVLEEGRVAEAGTHNALLAAGGRYSRMWQSYTSAINWDITAEGGANA
ncbi:MAG: ABC transporter ATP-binding protein [Oscillospiraceae bacterium]